MAAPAERSFLGYSAAGFHRLVYWECGAGRADAPTLAAVHGLTRNGRDFDTLAMALARDYRVACPDVVGRGHSDWLPDPKLYAYPQYLADAASLIARLNVGTLDWLGTSMGGLIGMLLAAQPKTPIKRLILNDVGPFIPKASLERIAAYIGETPRFETIGDLERHLRAVHAPFGPLSDTVWADMARHSARALPEGGFALAYDPGIAAAFNATPPADVDLWPVWEAVGCPVLVLRGAQSDLLTTETAAEMVKRKPGAELVEFADCGHAPSLTAPEQIAAIRDWLART